MTDLQYLIENNHLGLNEKKKIEVIEFFYIPDVDPKFLARTFYKNLEIGFEKAIKRYVGRRTFTVYPNNSKFSKIVIIGNIEKARSLT